MANSNPFNPNMLNGDVDLASILDMAVSAAASSSAVGSHKNNSMNIKPNKSGKNTNQIDNDNDDADNNIQMSKPVKKFKKDEDNNNNNNNNHINNAM
jgi:hypothetical protein